MITPPSLLRHWGRSVLPVADRGFLGLQDCRHGAERRQLADCKRRPLDNAPTPGSEDTQDPPCFGTVAAVESDIRLSHDPRLIHPALRNYRMAPGADGESCGGWEFRTCACTRAADAGRARRAGRGRLARAARPGRRRPSEHLDGPGPILRGLCSGPIGHARVVEPDARRRG